MDGSDIFHDDDGNQGCDEPVCGRRNQGNGRSSARMVGEATDRRQGARGEGGGGAVTPGCPITWGNCDPVTPVYFGKPTATPHHCSGVGRHKAKIHVCATCKCVGAVILPLADTRAGRELKAYVVGQRIKHLLNA